MDIINSKHLFFLITAVSVVTLKTFPSIFIWTGARDTWVITILASALILLFVWYLMTVCKKSGNYNLYDIYTKAVGRPAGTAFALLYLLTIFLSMFESVGAEASVIHNGFLILTPFWVFLVVTVCSAVYIVKKGIASVTMTTIITIIFISLSGMTLAVLTQKYKHLRYLFPVFEKGITGGFFLSLLQILGALSCFSIVIPYFDSIGDKTKLRKHTVIAMAYVVQIEIVSMLGVLSTFDVGRAERLVFPKLTQTQIVSVFGFIEAGELFVMLQVVAGWFIRYVVCFFAMMECFRLSGIKLRFKEYYAGGLTLLFSYLFAMDLFRMFQMISILLYIQFANFFAVPLVLYTVFFLRERKRKQTESEQEAASS